MFPHSARPRTRSACRIFGEGKYCLIFRCEAELNKFLSTAVHDLLPKFPATDDKVVGGNADFYTLNYIPNKMETPGPRTRSRARAEATLTVDQSSKTVADETLLAEGLSRESSLIPAYHYEDTIKDISLECMMGTPYPVELLKSKTMKVEPTPQETPKSPATAPAVDEKIEELATPEGDTEAATPFVDDQEISSDDHEVEEEEFASPGFELASALDSLTLGAYEEGEEEEDASLLEGPLRGMPAPLGAHIRFEDDGTENPSPRQKIFLRGVPEPLGKHTKFSASP